MEESLMGKTDPQNFIDMKRVALRTHGFEFIVNRYGLRISILTASIL